MRRLVLSMAAVFLLVMQAVAQTGGIVAGVLKEKASGMPMEFATVVLYGAKSQQVVSGSMTDSIGRFSIEKVSAGQYYVEGNYVGCKSVKSGVFSVEKGKTTNIGTIYIESKQLGEVVVQGHKSTFVAKLDRKVFNVGQDIMSNAGSASDLMQNIPSVEVDMDGTVSLRGNENVTILINGKPSAMMNAKTRGDALNQLSANSIERIELITNPSAQYKPDGMSGIINIVLKKDAKPGLNGSLTANVGSHMRSNAGVNLNYGAGRFNFFGGYSYRKDRYDRSTVDERSSATQHIDQRTYGLGRPETHTFRLGMNANLTSHDALEASGTYNRRRFKRNEKMTSLTEDLAQQPLDVYSRNRDALAKENMWEGALRYTHTYGKDSEWGLDYTYSSEAEDEMNHYTTSRSSSDTRDNIGVWDANYLHVATLHRSYRFSGGAKLSVGYELEHLLAEQNYHQADWDGTAFIPNANESSDFTFLRTINSLFGTWEQPLGQWKLLGGLRGEYANLENRLVSAGTSSKQHYANVYPTLHLSRPMGTHHELHLSYSLRVNRPEGEDMNPFAEHINPLSLQAGNPNLKPEKIHSVEAGWLWHNDGGASLMTTLYYRDIVNQITEVSRYIENGVLLTTKENLQSSQNAGAELIFNCPVAHWFSFNWNVNGYYNQIDASRLGFGKNKSTLAWSTLLNANFTPIKYYMVQLNARFRSSTLVPQGRRDADCRINLGMKYDIPAINLSLLATVTDLFDTYRKSYTLDTPELKQKVEKRRNPRIFYVGVSWQFGARKNKKHQTAVEYDEGL